MTKEELSILKQGDIILHEPSGVSYVVMTNVGGVPTVIRSIQLHAGNSPDWSHVYTPTPLVVPPAPAVVGVLDMITTLQSLGWTFNDDTNRWTSPDRLTTTTMLKYAWDHRNDFPKRTERPLPLPSVMLAELVDAGWKCHGMEWQQPGTICLYAGPAGAWRRMDNLKRHDETRAALRAAGWVNVLQNIWKSPSGMLFGGVKSAYAALVKGGNPS